MNRRPAAKSARPRIVIVGANFAGLAAAQQLGAGYDVTVMDRSPWFEWLPNLHELISGIKRPADLRLSRPRLVARAGHRFVRAEVVSIDAVSGEVTTATGRTIPFDACIVAIGGATETYGIKGAQRHALPFKTVAESEKIRRELARVAGRRGERRVVIVGGGLEGIEVLGEILRRYRNTEGLHVEVIEAGPTLLGGSPSAVDKAVRAHCVAHGVGVRTGSAVTAITSRGVQLRSGERVPSDLTLWTAGSAAPPLLLASGLANKPGQWAAVTNTLQSKHFDNVFLAGDAAGCQPPLAKQGFFALQMGECAAGNAGRALAGRPLRPFAPANKPMLIAFGDLDTFMVSGRAVIGSPGLAALKEAVFQATMAELDPPVSISALGDLSTRLSSITRKLHLPSLAAAAIGVGYRRGPARSRDARRTR